MQSRIRSAFTLIELMVAMALTLFIMIILTQAFTIALETFSLAKGIGDMQQNLRVASVLLRDDLTQDHLEAKRRLSDLTMTGGSTLAADRPQAGFFAVIQGSASLLEGYDQNGLASYRATNHALYMTVRRKGNRPDNFFNTALPGMTAADVTAFYNQQSAYNTASGELSSNTYNPPVPGYYSSQWAEVMYYLVRTGSTEQPNNPAATIGTPTFSLMRAEFLMVPNATQLNPQTYSALAPFAGLSCNPGGTGLTFYSPADAALSNRMVPSATNVLASLPPDTTTMATNRIGAASTLVLPSVVSFQIQVMPTGQTTFMDVGTYDTTQVNAGAAFPNNGGLKAIQITVRVFDTKTRQTRQITVIQDM